MKNYLSKPFQLLIGILAGILIVLFIAGCTSPQRSTSEVSVLDDITEIHQAQPNANEIMQLFNLGTDKWNGASFTFAYITDVSYNRQTYFTLTQGGSRLTSSTFMRDKEVNRFRDSIAGLLESLKSDTIGRPNSSVYIPLAEELNRLSVSSSKQKTLLVYSDFMENETTLSFYDKKTLALLASNPDRIKSLLLAKVPLKKLNGINVYFIFQPQNANEDATFRLVSGFYKTLLEDQGTHVTIAANVAVVNNSLK